MGLGWCLKKKHKPTPALLPMRASGGFGSQSIPRRSRISGSVPTYIPSLTLLFFFFVFVSRAANKFTLAGTLMVLGGCFLKGLLLAGFFFVIKCA